MRSDASRLKLWLLKCVWINVIGKKEVGYVRLCEVRLG